MDIENLLNKLPRLNLEDKLYLNRFKVNNGHPHLSIKHKELCQRCEEKSCVYVCPVENYKMANGEIELSWEGCLECGSCRIACKYGAIEWNYPQGGFGIKYRYG
jgi:ferredoxin like protein